MRPDANTPRLDVLEVFRPESARHARRQIPARREPLAAERGR
jgi:hypothetical protein